jgi:hypothetical protein
LNFEQIYECSGVLGIQHRLTEELMHQRKFDETAPKSLILNKKKDVCNGMALTPVLFFDLSACFRPL